MIKTVKLNESGELMFGEETLLSSAENKSFPQMVFEMLSGRSPKEIELKLFELILNLSIDHGPDSPSAAKTIEQADAGEPISEAVAEGIEEINYVHGGAITPAMGNIYKVVSGELTAKDFVEVELAEDRKIAGLGHRIHKNLDPRAQLILNTMKDEGFGVDFVEALEDIQAEVNLQSEKSLPINIDGAIAACLCAFEWDPKLGVAVFIIARTPGLCAQYLENS